MSDRAERGQLTAFPDALKNLTSKTLVVGDIVRWKAEGRTMDPFDGFQFVDIEDLNADLVNEKEPDIILSPLVGDDFDAVDVAIKLIELKFKGRYRAISDEMPDAELIRKEVRAFAPQLDFDLLLMPRMEAGE